MKYETKFQKGRNELLRQRKTILNSVISKGVSQMQTFVEMTYSRNGSSQSKAKNQNANIKELVCRSKNKQLFH